MYKLPINEKLIDIRIMSYYSFGEMVSKCLIVFLNFSDDLWYKVVLSDGKSSIKVVSVPIITDIKNGEEFDYPISVYSDVDFKRYGGLKKGYEYFWDGKKDESCGFAFLFENGNFLYIIEIEDETVISTNYEDIQDNWHRIEIKESSKIR